MVHTIERPQAEKRRFQQIKDESDYPRNLMDSTHPQTVMSMLNEQRSQSLFCDVTIVVEDIMFRAHKSILAACSEYFRNALTTEGWRANQVVELMDFKPEVFAKILNFMYGSSVTFQSADEMSELIATAKRLGIPSFGRQGQAVHSQDENTAPPSKKARRNAPKQEEIYSAGMPYIISSSMTEVCPEGDPFTPLVEAAAKKQTPKQEEMYSAGMPHIISALTEVCPEGDRFTPLAETNSERQKAVFGGLTSPMPDAVENDGHPNGKAPTLTGLPAAPATVTRPAPIVSEAEADKYSGMQVSPKTVEADLSEIPQDGKPVRPSGTQQRYTCSECQRVYATRASLRRHENTHYWLKSYPCQYCDKIFAMAEQRTRHEIRHTGEGRYQCLLCLENLVTKNVLERHQKSVHGIDPKKKSADGDLSAGVFPDKLYRILPRQSQTINQTCLKSIERPDQSSPCSQSLVPPFEDNDLIS